MAARGGAEAEIAAGGSGPLVDWWWDLDKFPFSVYDFLAYISSGMVLLVTADYIWGLGLLSRKEASPIFSVVVALLAYVAGHVAAHFSTWFFEHLLVGRVLQRPSTLLLGGAPRWKPLAWIFPHYHRAFPPNIQKRIREVASERHCMAEGEGLFLHAYPIVTALDKNQARLDIFLNQYGFARNMAVAFFTSAIGIALERRYGIHPVSLRWAALAIIGDWGCSIAILNSFGSTRLNCFCG